MIELKLKPSSKLKLNLFRIKLRKKIKLFELKTKKCIVIDNYYGCFFICYVFINLYYVSYPSVGVFI